MEQSGPFGSISALFGVTVTQDFTMYELRRRQSIRLEGVSLGSNSLKSKQPNPFNATEAPCYSRIHMWTRAVRFYLKIK